MAIDDLREMDARTKSAIDLFIEAVESRARLLMLQRPNNHSGEQHYEKAMTEIREEMGE